MTEIYIPPVGNGKKRVVKGDINRGLLAFARRQTRTRGRGKKEKSEKRGYKSVIFEDASSIPYTSLWMDVRFVVTYAEMSPEIVEGEEGRRSLGMVYNRIKVSRLGRRRRRRGGISPFLPRELLMDVRERSWLGESW